MSKNCIIIDGKEIKLSEETVKNIVGQLGEQETGFEKMIDGIRVSTYRKDLRKNESCPIRISIPATTSGATTGRFGHVTDSDQCPGQVINKSEAKRLIKAIQQVIEFVEKF